MEKSISFFCAKIAVFQNIKLFPCAETIFLTTTKNRDNVCISHLRTVMGKRKGEIL